MQSITANTSFSTERTNWVEAVTQAETLTINGPQQKKKQELSSGVAHFVENCSEKLRAISRVNWRFGKKKCTKCQVAVLIYKLPKRFIYFYIPTSNFLKLMYRKTRNEPINLPNFIKKIFLLIIKTANSTVNWINNVSFVIKKHCFTWENIFSTAISENQWQYRDILLIKILT